MKTFVRTKKCLMLAIIQLSENIMMIQANQMQMVGKMIGKMKDQLVLRLQNLLG